MSTNAPPETIDPTTTAPPRAGERDAAAPRRLLAFLVERFPPAPQLVLMTVLFFAGTTSAATLWAPAAGAAALSPASIPVLVAGFVVGLLFVVHLRVMDDVKDAPTDRVENPDRPVPRGLVSERELDVLTAVLLAAQAAIVVAIGPVATATWTIAALWSVLMRAEFFVGKHIERHVTTFAATHMAVLGMLFGFLVAVGIEATGPSPAALAPWTEPVVLAAMAAATIVGIGFEWGRRFERYHAALGGLAWVLWIAWPALGVGGFALLADGRLGSGTATALLVTMGLALGAGVVIAVRCRRASAGAVPTGAMREVVEAVPGAAGLACYGAIAVHGIGAMPW